MLKNKSKIIALLTLIVLAFTIGIVNADNEEPVAVSSETSTSIENPDTNQAIDPHATEPISEGGENTEATPAENNMKSFFFKEIERGCCSRSGRQQSEVVYE